ncbi:MAG: cellulose synthase family protein [Elusimicrobiota bacterium]
MSQPVFLPQDTIPFVTVQLPLYNEFYVSERLIQAVADLDYPIEKLEIQVLDDSIDETVERVAKEVEKFQLKGINIKHIRRSNRDGFKAGALAYGLQTAQGEFVAIFDADFIPPKDFLKKTIPHFQKPEVGMVQTRWGHINASYSLLTRLQALFLDGHFMLEHTARYKSGSFFNFNGTAGVWRKKAIEDGGGWSPRTLTEDLDLSYRVQLAGWRFIYLPDYVCPAELPVDISSFRSQQHRWTKGALQVARYILKDIWKAKIPFHTKMESTIHLTGNVGYLLSLIISILILPSLYWRSEFESWLLYMVELVVFFTTTVSVVSFYIVSQKEIYSDWKTRIRDIPALLSFGIGMGLFNTRAVIEGLLGHQSEFIRTPKYNIQNKSDLWIKKIYSNKKKKISWMALFFSLYSVVTIFIAVILNHWFVLPFLFLFVFGFFYIASLYLRPSFQE